MILFLTSDIFVFDNNVTMSKFQCLFLVLTSVTTNRCITLCNMKCISLFGSIITEISRFFDSFHSSGINSIISSHIYDNPIWKYAFKIIRDEFLSVPFRSDEDRFLSKLCYNVYCAWIFESHNKWLVLADIGNGWSYSYMSHSQWLHEKNDLRFPDINVLCGNFI